MKALLRRLLLGVKHKRVCCECAYFQELVLTQENGEPYTIKKVVGDPTCTRCEGGGWVTLVIRGSLEPCSCCKPSSL